MLNWLSCTATRDISRWTEKYALLTCGSMKCLAHMRAYALLVCEKFTRRKKLIMHICARNILRLAPHVN